MSQKECPHIQKALFCYKLMVVWILRISDPWWHTFPVEGQKLCDQTHIFFTRGAKLKSWESSTWVTAWLKVAASPGSQPRRPGTLRASKGGGQGLANPTQRSHSNMTVSWHSAWAQNLCLRTCSRLFHSLARGGSPWKKSAGGEPELSVGRIKSKAAIGLKTTTTQNQKNQIRICWDFGRENGEQQTAQGWGWEGWGASWVWSGTKFRRQCC